MTDTRWHDEGLLPEGGMTGVMSAGSVVVGDRGVAPGWRGPLSRLIWPRLAGWAELATVAAIYAFYEASRALASPRTAPAVTHARDVLKLEQLLHLDPELALNRALQSSDFLADTAGYYYSTLHFLVTPIVLVYLWWRRPLSYPRLRTTLVVATLAGLLTYVAWPVAPPRFATPGVTDTLAQQHVFGAHGVSGVINQYAAMPSLHVGWAIWCAIAIEATSVGPWRHLAWLYPIATTMVVMSTGNHYSFDAVGGAVLILAAVALTARPAPPRPPSDEQSGTGEQHGCRPAEHL
jgi:hypothetical protein